jgi:hypothetical protein
MTVIGISKATARDTNMMHTRKQFQVNIRKADSAVKHLR